jgi:hypothetical protein
MKTWINLKISNYHKVLYAVFGFPRLEAFTLATDECEFVRLVRMMSIDEGLFVITDNTFSNVHIFQHRIVSWYSSNKKVWICCVVFSQEKKENRCEGLVWKCRKPRPLLPPPIVYINIIYSIHSPQLSLDMLDHYIYFTLDQSFK